MNPHDTQGSDVPGDQVQDLAPSETGALGKPVPPDQDDDEGDLIDPSPPPPDRPVIGPTTPEEKDRAWLLRSVMIFFGIALVAAWALAATLSVDKWKQVEPLASRGVELLATLITVIIGFYFGNKNK